MDIYGTWRKAMNYKALDVMAVPCITSFEGEKDQTDKVRDDCVTDQEEVFKYLGDGSQNQVVIYFN